MYHTAKLLYILDYGKIILIADFVKTILKLNPGADDCEFIFLLLVITILKIIIYDEKKYLN